MHIIPKIYIFNNTHFSRDNHTFSSCASFRIINGNSRIKRCVLSVAEDIDFPVHLITISRITISAFPPLTRVYFAITADPLCLIVTSSTRITHPFSDQSVSRWNRLWPTLRDHDGWSPTRSAIVKLNRTRLRRPWLSTNGISMGDAPGRLHPAVVSYYSLILYLFDKSLTSSRAQQALSCSLLLRNQRNYSFCD